MGVEQVMKSTLKAVNAFNEAFNKHDVDAVMATMSRDCVFENTFPAPDGIRYVGQDAVRSVWEEFFSSSPNANFETEEMFVAVDRCIVRWLYRWIDEEGKPGHVRGADIIRVRDGKITEKLSYVKG